MRVEQPHSPTRRAALFRIILPVSIAALLLAAITSPGAQDLLPEEDQGLLVEAVEAAFELDLYNARCRNDQSGRRTENLNKELVSRYRMTILDVQDDLFPEGYYRDAQARMRAEFLAELRDIGGCEGAKADGLRDRLGARYDAAMAAIGSRP